MPQQCVAAHELSVTLRPVDYLVGVPEVEPASRGCDGLALSPRYPTGGPLTLNGVPLHAVLAGDLAKLSFGNVYKRRVTEMVVVDFRPKVQLALGLEARVQACGGPGLEL